MRRFARQLAPMLWEASGAGEAAAGTRFSSSAAASSKPRMPVRHPRPSAAVEAAAAAAAEAVEASRAAGDAAASRGSSGGGSSSASFSTRGGGFGMFSTTAGGAGSSAAAVADGGARLQTAAEAAEAAAARSQHDAATSVTRTMLFPWEKRQFSENPGGLRPWEKVYWGVFVTAMAVLLFSRVAVPAAKKEPEVDEEKEKRKAEMARMLLAGGCSFTEADADVFEGLSPAEIQAYVAETTQGAPSHDPFEGMSPDEINEYLEKNAVPGRQT